MRARAAWVDEHLCPSCGWPKEICQAPETEFAVEVPAPTRCHVTTAMRRAQKDYASKTGANPEGLLWAATLRDAESARSTAE